MECLLAKVTLICSDCDVTGEVSVLPGNMVHAYAPYERAALPQLLVTLSQKAAYTPARCEYRQGVNMMVQGVPHTESCLLGCGQGWQR